VLVVAPADAPEEAFSAVGLKRCLRLPEMTGYRFEATR